MLVGSEPIEVDKEYLKFSAAHFLIFPDGSAERLHGHNYRVYVEVEAGDSDVHGGKTVVDYGEDGLAVYSDGTKQQRAEDAEAAGSVAPASTEGDAHLRRRRRLRRVAKRGS